MKTRALALGFPGLLDITSASAGHSTAGVSCALSPIRGSRTLAPRSPRNVLRMGIRYYAYAFSADVTPQAVDNPHSMLSSDPLADAWGMEPHARLSSATFEQVSSERDMLYLDKAWSALQSLTCATPESPGTGAAYRMFEGTVMMRDMGWEPWVRAILPQEVPSIRDDLMAIDESRVRTWAGTWCTWRGTKDEGEIGYILSHLTRAQSFVRSLVANGRGMVYLIG